MGSETFSNVGGAATDNITVSNAREISRTFFERDGSVSVYFLDLNVTLKARGTLKLEATAVAKNGDPKSGSAHSKIAATADLTTIGTLSAGIYVARVEAKGTVKLVELKFSPTLMATRRFDDRDSVPASERGIYTVSAVAPLNVTGLDGKLTVAAYIGGGPSIPFIGRIEAKVAETTVWDPDPLVSFNANLVSRRKTRAFWATFL